MNFASSAVTVMLGLFCPSGSATLERYKAAMLLSGVGDALGYRNQLWEYNESGPAIHQASARRTGKEKSHHSRDHSLTVEGSVL